VRVEFLKKNTDLGLLGIFATMVLLSIASGLTISFLTELSPSEKITDPELIGYGKAGYEQKLAQEREARKYGFASGRDFNEPSVITGSGVLEKNLGSSSLVSDFFATGKEGAISIQLPSTKYAWLSVSVTYRTMSILAGLLTLSLCASIVPVWQLLNELNRRDNPRQSISQS